MSTKNFLGAEFFWWYGVVEDRADPLNAGRVRVRILGLHTKDRNAIPTADLPWATVLGGTNSAGISGLGFSPPFLVEGSWVMGFFRDGEKQEPVVLGSAPGYPIEKAKDTGFYDPQLIYPRHVNETDVNRLAYSDNHPSTVLRKATRLTNIATADFNSVSAADGSVINPSDGGTFDQPPIPHAPIYPYNHVTETEAGHILEFDDTNDNERIHLRHAAGSSLEYTATDTTQIHKNDNTILTSNNENHYIGGHSNVTIDGHHKLFINKSQSINNHYNIQIGANANINIQVDSGNVNIVTVQGKINLNAGGDYNVKVGGNYTLTVAGNKTEVIEGTKTSNTTGAVIHRGKTIDLNP